MIIRARQRYVFAENALSVLDSLYSLVYVYNFVVYVSTGSQFRAELRRLFCVCQLSTSSSTSEFRGRPAV